MGFASKNIVIRKPKIKIQLDRVESLLVELTDTPPLNKGLPRIYRFSTISQRFDVPKSTLRLELESGRLQGFKIGQSLQIGDSHVKERDGSINHCS